MAARQTTLDHPRNGARHAADDGREICERPATDTGTVIAHGETRITGMRHPHRGDWSVAALATSVASRMGARSLHELGIVFVVFLALVVRVVIVIER
jgi:hypothetical protein